MSLSNKIIIGGNVQGKISQSISYSGLNNEIFEEIDITSSGIKNLNIVSNSNKVVICEEASLTGIKILAKGSADAFKINYEIKEGSLNIFSKTEKGNVKVKILLPEKKQFSKTVIKLDIGSVLIKMLHAEELEFSIITGKIKVLNEDIKKIKGEIREGSFEIGFKETENPLIIVSKGKEGNIDSDFPINLKQEEKQKIIDLTIISGNVKIYKD